MPKLPSVDDATEYYKKSMMTGMMMWFCRMSGKKKYSEADIQSMKATAKLKAGDRNHIPGTWIFMSMKTEAAMKLDLQPVEYADL